jgi:hypothetical protein
MAGDDDKKQLQDMRDEIDGLVTDIKMIHERVDSTVTTTNLRFDQLDLAQIVTKTTLDAIVSRLDALNTVVTDLVAQGCAGDDEEMLIAEAKPAVYHAAPLVMIPSLKSNLKFHHLMATMILLHILIGN